MVSAYAIIGIVCFVEWGIIHVGCFGLFMSFVYKDDASGMGEMYATTLGSAPQKVKDNFRSASFPKFSNRYFIQHAMNLGWAGFWSFFVAIVVSNQNAYFENLARYAWLLTVPVLLFDWGYFVAVDIPKLGEAPAEAQTFICSLGSALLAYDAYLQYNGITTTEVGVEIFFSLILTLAGTLNAIKHAVKSE